MNTLLLAVVRITGGHVCGPACVAAQSVFHFPRVSVSEGGGVGGGVGSVLAYHDYQPVGVCGRSRIRADWTGRLAQFGAPANPVRYRVEPDSVLSMGIDTVFATSGASRVDSRQQ